MDNSRNSIAAGSTTTQTAARVIPLLQTLNRIEELITAMALRLDPITNHMPQQDRTDYATTVTGRLQSLGDTLQYLLDNIEL